jgi:hypothetical protein
MFQIYEALTTSVKYKITELGLHVTMYNREYDNIL